MSEPRGDELNRQIQDAVSALVKQATGLAHAIAGRYGMPLSELVALYKVEAHASMKEIGQRLGCDPSFVTSIADLLEKGGLARREPDQRDRRVKNLVLTERGVELKTRLEREVRARMPWARALDVDERRCFLGLLRKMIEAGDAAEDTVPGGAAATVPATAARDSTAKRDSTATRRG